MRPEDLVLEATRLIGYQRRGSRITDRLEAALDLLQEHHLVSYNDKTLELVSTDPFAEQLLEGVYTSGE
jgi:hypothetical protein